MSLPRVLVVDDQFARDPSLRQTFIENSGLVEAGGQAFSDPPLAEAEFCSGQRRKGDRVVNDYQVVRAAVTAGPAGEAGWALVFLDVRFDSRPQAAGDDSFGEEIGKRLAVDFPDLPVVMLSSKRQTELRDRGTPYLSKIGLGPRDIAVCLLLYGRLSPEQQRRLLALPDGVVARDPASFAVFREAFRIAGGAASVLILGETGTGKEVLARYIHQRSHRAGGPFVPVNMAAIPAELVESILFGHERGAFTGADRRQVGLFVKADGGTLFLDEIGDMPPALQTKVLRALQDGEVLPVGAPKPVRVDVRVVSATSRDLAAMRDNGRFRDDLLRRISGETLVLPPLRERPGDIAELARLFLEKNMARTGRQGIGFAEDALGVLRQHPFTGNIGELEQIVASLVGRKGNNSVISAADVRQALAASFISAGEALAPPEKKPVAPGPAASGLDRLIGMIETWPAAPDDPALKGGKPRLEQAVRGLLARMAGAALERFRDPRSGRLNRQAAMQWLTGDDTLKGKGPRRVLNEILDRRADAPVADDDVEKLASSSQTGRARADR